MSVENIKELFKKNNIEELILHSEEISDTVIHAAKLLGCEPKQIAKTMSFVVYDNPIVIVSSGDSKIDNSKYKAYFKTKAKMIPFNEVERITGHTPGGICPLDINEGARVCLDISLKRFDIIYTGGGDEHTTIKVNIEQLERYSNYTEWIDICNGWNN